MDPDADPRVSKTFGSGGSGSGFGSATLISGTDGEMIGREGSLLKGCISRRPVGLSLAVLWSRKYISFSSESAGRKLRITAPAPATGPDSFVTIYKNFFSNHDIFL
jgi:hypothetical protein